MLGRLAIVRCLLPARPTSELAGLAGCADAAAARTVIGRPTPSRGGFPAALPFAVLFRLSS